MYKIDKSTWDQMSSNKDRVVIKQWVPQSHVIGEKSDLTEKNNTVNNVKPIKTHSSNPNDIIEKALAEAEEIKKNAYTEGYKSGLDQVRNKLDIAYQRQSKELADIISEINTDKKALYEEMEEKSLRLALAVAEKILNMKIENDDKVFVGLVRNALSIMDEEEKLILKLNKREYEKYFKDRHLEFLDELKSEAQVTVVKDNSLSAGGIIIESEKSFIDASVDTQIEKISNSIAKRDTQYHEAL